MRNVVGSCQELTEGGLSCGSAYPRKNPIICFLDPRVREDDGGLDPRVREDDGGLAIVIFTWIFTLEYSLRMTW